MRRLNRTRSPLVSPGSGQNTLCRLPTGTSLPPGSLRTPRFRLDSSARNWSQSASMLDWREVGRESWQWHQGEKAGMRISSRPTPDSDTSRYVSPDTSPDVSPERDAA